MKKILSIILPSMTIFLVAFLSKADKNILHGLFLIFPIIFIVQGVIYSDFKKELLLGFGLSSIAFIIPINLFYNMGSCIQIVIIYNFLGIISYYAKNKINGRKK